MDTASRFLTHRDARGRPRLWALTAYVVSWGVAVLVQLLTPQVPEGAPWAGRYATGMMNELDTAIAHGE
jgi:hypothetical protein